MQKNLDSKNPRVVKTKIGRLMFFSNCAVSDSKKMKFIKGQRASGLLSKLTGVKVSILSDIPGINNILF